MRRMPAVVLIVLSLFAVACSSSDTWRSQASHTASPRSATSASVDAASTTTTSPTAPPVGYRSTGHNGATSVTHASYASDASGQARVTRLPYASPITLEKHMPADIPVGRDFEYRLIVRNATQVTFRDVAVTEQLPRGFTVTAAGPTASSLDVGKAVWTFRQIGPGQAHAIRVIGKVDSPGALQGCSFVTFSPYLCTTTNAMQPSLRLTRNAPSVATVCDGIPVRYIVTNTGTGLARQVEVSERLPQGVLTSEGRSVVAFDAGDLASGQSRAFDVQLKAASHGEFTSQAVARSSNGLEASAPGATAVHAPQLEVTSDGPRVLQVGRNATYHVTVKNTGNAPATQTIVEQQLPGGVQLVSMTQGGQLSADKITWPVGTLGVGQARQYTAIVRPSDAGAVRAAANARARCAKAVSSEVTTAVTGIPAILMEVVDADDPIAVGSNVTYIIEVVNQGSAAATNIVVICDLEETMRFVSADGSTTGSAVGSRVTFAPVARLAPKAKATWRVTVNAASPADARFKVAMTSNQIKRPVEETEATNFYE